MSRQRQQTETQGTDGTDGQPHLPGFIPPHGGYRDLLSYPKTQIIETRPPEVVANILVCLIHQANYLLDRQLSRLEQEFLQQGGLREPMTRARLAARHSSQ